MPRYRSGSILFAGHECQFSHSDGIRWQARAALEARNTRFPGLSPETLEAHLRNLFRALRMDGRILPTIADLAAMLGRGAKTVHRCNEAGRMLGVIRWTNRLKEVDGGFFQTSNSYVLLLPPLIHVPPESFGIGLSSSLTSASREPVDNSWGTRFRRLMMVGEWIADRWRRYMRLE